MLKIKDIFYDKILKQIALGTVKVGDFIFNIGFDTIVKEDNKIIKEYHNSNDITLEIKDRKLFDEALEKYTKTFFNHIKKEEKFQKIDYVYFDGDEEKISEFILATAFNNASFYDFQNPVNYLNKRIDFFNCPLFHKYHDKTTILENVDLLAGSNISVQVVKTSPVLETPYKFSPQIYRDDEVYHLPDIYYGISAGTCYIYAINSKKTNNDSKYVKKINRLLYKIEQGITLKEENNFLKDTTKSHVLALLLFIKILNKNNISNLEIIDYLPIRHQAKEQANKYKAMKVESPIEKEKLNLDQARIDKNMIEKPTYELTFLQESLKGIKITSYQDLDNRLKAKIAVIKDEEATNFLNKINNLEIEEGKMR